MAARKSTKKRVAKKATPRKATARKTTAKKVTPGTAAASKTFAKGDHVTWGTPQGETQGVVERKLTRPTTIKTHKVAASPENPEYLVRSDKSGQEAAHKPSSLRKRKTD